MNVDGNKEEGTSWTSSVLQLLATFITVLLAWVLVTVKSLHSAHQLFTEKELAEGDEEWWERSKDSRYSRLLVPPDCITPDRPASGKNASPAVQTKRLMKGMYRVATGSNKYKYKRLGWSVNRDRLNGSDFLPVLCFVNSKSGGQQGAYFQFELKRLLNPIQIIDLNDIDPSVPLRAFADFGRFRVLVAGGDGTIGWVLDAIDELNLSYRPPVAILSIGTGNDLANELGWLTVLRSSTLPSILEKVQNAQSVTLDRWTFTQEVILKETRSSGGKSSAKSNSSAKYNHTTSFQNYFGIGVDAQIALQFHTMRKSSPYMFFHSYVNKFWYGIMGYREFWRSATPIPFCQQVELYCDDKLVAIPVDAQGIVFLNISSYGGGSRLWNSLDSTSRSEDSTSSDDEIKHGKTNTKSQRLNSRKAKIQNEDEDSDYDFGGGLSLHHLTTSSSTGSLHERVTNRKWLPPSCNDGLLEVVAVKSSLELAQIKLGITSCQKLAQGKSFRLRTFTALPMQFDGEPRMQSGGSFTIAAKEMQAMMLKPVPDDMDLDLVEVLEWASRQHVITNVQQEMIMSEYIKRVERRRWRDVQWS